MATGRDAPSVTVPPAAATSRMQHRLLAPTTAAAYSTDTFRQPTGPDSEMNRMRALIHLVDDSQPLPPEHPAQRYHAIRWKTDLAATPGAAIVPIRRMVEWFHPYRLFEAAVSHSLQAIFKNGARRPLLFDHAWLARRVAKAPGGLAR